MRLIYHGTVLGPCAVCVESGALAWVEGAPAGRRWRCAACRDPRRAARPRQTGCEDSTAWPWVLAALVLPAVCVGLVWLARG